MPRCEDCGNTERFVYQVEGTEVRVFDDAGQHTDTENSVLETTAGPRCAECESWNVENTEDE